MKHSCWSLLCATSAGANTLADESPTAEGVGALAQVNYLGPYALTRLLLEEGDDPRRLQASAPAPARVGVGLAARVPMESSCIQRLISHTPAHV